MVLFLILVGGGAGIVSGLLYCILKKSILSTAVSILAPMTGFISYGFYTKDEFGLWLLALSFGLIACLIGSVISIVVINLLKK